MSAIDASLARKFSYTVATSCVLVGLFAGQVNAAPVNLTGWIENGYQGNNGAGTWTVQGPGSSSVLQSSNGNPTVFFEPGDNAQGTALSGSIKVETSSDDDFVGFVLGYQNGELNSVNADFWLIDWKQGTQTVSGSQATAGLALNHVSGNLNAAPGAFTSGLWGHDTSLVNEVARGSTLGMTGWNDNQEYTFELIFTSSLIKVFVDGVEQISHAGSFSDGAFGFYNFSQSQVRYAGIEEDIVPSAVPLPAAFPLLAGGLGFLGLAGWRRRRKVKATTA